MTTHLLEREQWLPISIGEAWSFFSSPLNLAKITPDDMGFVIRQPFQDKPIRSYCCCLLHNECSTANCTGG